MPGCRRSDRRDRGGCDRPRRHRFLQVVVGVLGQFFEMVGEEVVGAVDDAVVDPDVALMRQFMHQLGHRRFRHHLVLAAMQDQTR